MEKVLSVCVLFINFVVYAQNPGGELNDPCVVVSQCRNFGYICGRNRTCQCFTGYIPNKYFDKCIGGVDQNCKYDEHCIEGAFCLNQQKCQCKEFLYPGEDGLTCSNSSTVHEFQGIILVIFLLLYLKIV